MFKLPYNCTHLNTQKECSKFSKPGFKSLWIENFQMFKLCLEKAEEQEIDPKSKRVPEKIYFCFIDYAKAFDCIYHNTLW